MSPNQRVEVNARDTRAFLSIWSWFDTEMKE